MSKHLVKGHIWNAIEGRFAIFERYFDSLEEAKSHTESEPAYTHFKVYSDDGELVHSGTNEQNVPTSNYA
jgi:hypothetical protein